jgi:class 3 adenylate cyclase
VLATILFSDIVDSTAQSAALGDSRWREISDRHDQVTRSQLGRFRGREVRWTGDGFLAVFDGPARAVRCAQESNWDDIAGLAVAIGARVGALAEAGEVLVSSTVKEPAGVA